jgi:hypothetical protein
VHGVWIRESRYPANCKRPINAFGSVSMELFLSRPIKQATRFVLVKVCEFDKICPCPDDFANDGENDRMRRVHRHLSKVFSQTRGNSTNVFFEQLQEIWVDEKKDTGDREVKLETSKHLESTQSTHLQESSVQVEPSFHPLHFHYPPSYSSL